MRDDVPPQQRPAAIRIERWLNFLIVTPRMHGIHHSIVRDETDSNYSVIFRWWDRLHGSLRLNVAQRDVTIGVAAYQKPNQNRVLNLLEMPFERHRDDWHLPDGTAPMRRQAGAAKTAVILSEPDERLRLSPENSDPSRSQPTGGRTRGQRSSSCAATAPCLYWIYEQT